MISTPTTAITAASLMAAGTLEARQANARSFTFTLPTGSTFNGHAAVYLELRETGVLGEDGLLARVSSANPTGGSVTLTLSIEQMNQPVIGDSKEFGLWLYVDEHQLIYEGLLTLYADETAHSLTDDPPTVTEINLTRTLADTLYKPIDAASGGEWGAITGTLSDQLDLKGVLDGINSALGDATSEIADASNQFVAESSKLVRWGVDGELHAGTMTQNGSTVLDTSNLGVSGGAADHDATQTALGTKVTVGGDAGTPSAIVLTNATFPSSIVTLTGSQTLTNKTLTSPTLTAPALGTPASGTLTNCTSIPAAQLTGDVAVARIATALSAPGPIGGTTPGTGAFTTVALTNAFISTASGFVSLKNAANTNHAITLKTQGIWTSTSSDGSTRTGDWGGYTPHLSLGLGNRIIFESTTNITAAGDCGISRNAAGVIEINNGTAGTFRDLKLRTLCPDSTNTTAGTTGAQTINKAAGSVNFAAGASSLVVTCSLCATTSEVLAICATNDSTAWVKSVVPAAGSFTIFLGAAATAETRVQFFLLN